MANRRTTEIDRSVAQTAGSVVRFASARLTPPATLAHLGNAIIIPNTGR
jgi:hypothetical protein